MSAIATSTPAPALDVISNASATATIDALRNVIANPDANPTLTLLFVAVAALVVLLVAVLVVMIVTPTRKRIVKVRRYVGPRPEGAPAQAAPQTATRPQPKRRRTIPRQVANIIAAGIIAVALVASYAATSTDVYCSRTCHANTPAVTAATSVDHAPCFSCHEESLFSLVANTTSRARMLVRYTGGASPSAARVTVDSTACLQCHQSVRKGVVTNERTGIRMSHAEVLEGGLPCGACHESAGHSADAFTGSMSVCVPCHDAERASAECTTCHTTDPGAMLIAGDPAASGESTGAIVGSGKLTYPAVTAAKRECGGCHDEPTTCDPCHGIRMPHTQEFKEGGHAVNAAFERKKTCWQCHDPQSCAVAACHRGAFDPVTGSTTHGRAWKAEHGVAGWDAGCVCHERGAARRAKPMCYLCHAEDHTPLPLGH